MSAHLAQIADYLTAALPGCSIRAYENYVLVSFAGVSTGVRTMDQARDAVGRLREHAAREAAYKAAVAELS